MTLCALQSFDDDDYDNVHVTGSKTAVDRLRDERKVIVASEKDSTV